MNILILQPTAPQHPPALQEIAARLLARLPEANPGLMFDIAVDDTAVPIPASPSLYAKHAAVRNYMLDTYLKPEHDRVLWIDSDLVDYPANLPALLLEANHDGIAAPLVLLDQCGPRYYDIGGFIEEGRRFRMVPPYCTQTGPLWELDSVGCCYLIPAWLYREGVRYSPPPTDYYVEHWSVMQEAKAKGVKIVALRDIVAKHAYLPLFGLPNN